MPDSQGSAKAAVFVCKGCGSSAGRRFTGAGCLICLLQGGLDPAEPIEQPGSGRIYQHFQVLTDENGRPHELGRGAMGVTYKALDTNLRVPVALKVIRPALSGSADAQTRFLHEARSAARLRHPNVASVFHYGLTDPPPGGQAGEGACFYAMEFVDGETLEARLHRTGPLPPALALEIAAQVARSLVAAEKQGLVHRDLKPANIMLVADAAASGHGDHAWVKVIDFGLAETVAHGGRPARDRPHFSGTPGFASPEQLRGGEVDSRSDIFSLGVTLWCAICGKLPFGNLSPADFLHRPEWAALPLAQLDEARVPLAVVGLLQRMLAAAPADRFPTADAMNAAVQECLTTLGRPPGQASPRASELYRLAKSALGGSVPSQARFEEAIRLLEEALRLDPAFVRAHALMGEVHALAYRKSYDRSPARAARVLAAAETALRLRPDSGEARRALGVYYYYIQRDYARAAEEFGLALAALPDDAETLFCLGLTARRQNRWEEAAPCFQAAAGHDPYHSDYGTHWWKTLAGLRRYEEARGVLDRLMAAQPEQFYLRIHRAFLTYQETADLRPLHEALSQLPAGYDPNGSVTFMRVGIARYECDAGAAERALAASPLPAFQGHVDGQMYPREALHFLNLMLREGYSERVRAIAASLAPGSLAHANSLPDEPGPWAALSQLQAIAGHRAEALEAGHRALGLLPPEKDGVDGPMLAVQLAWSYLHLNEPGPAMDLLKTYAPWPGGLSYGDLLLGNTYDLLRSDPCYPALLLAVKSTHGGAAPSIPPDPR